MAEGLSVALEGSLLLGTVLLDHFGEPIGVDAVGADGLDSALVGQNQFDRQSVFGADRHSPLLAMLGDLADFTRTRANDLHNIEYIGDGRRRFEGLVEGAAQKPLIGLD